MKHIVFVESSKPGVRAFGHAHNMGCRITWITSNTFNWLLSDEDHKQIHALIDTEISIEDTQSTEQVQQALAAIHAQDPIDAVLTSLHYCVLSTAHAAKNLNLLSTNPVGIENAINKHRCREILAENGLNSVQHAVASSFREAQIAADEIGYPVIVKPVSGAGKILTEVIEDVHQLERYFALSKASYDAIDPSIKYDIAYEFIIEEIAQGSMYSIEFALTQSGRAISLVTLRRKRGKHNQILEMGSVIPCGLSETEQQKLDDYIEDVARAIGLDFGIFHIEAIVGKDGPKLIEVNPRIAGGAIPDLIRSATDTDLFEILPRLFIEEDPELDTLPIIHCTSHTYIAVKNDQVIRKDLPENWFDPIKDRIFEGYADIMPGQRLAPMTTNYGTYGVVRVRSKSPESALQETESLRLEIEKILGVPLVEVML